MIKRSSDLSNSRIDAVAIRRDLHRFPELAFLEYRTASKVARTLSDLGFAVRTGPEAMVRDAIIAPPLPPPWRRRRRRRSQRAPTRNGSRACRTE